MTTVGLLRLHHIGIGRTHARTHVLLLVQGRHIHVIHAATGELLHELQLDPTSDYQPTGAPKGSASLSWRLSGRLVPENGHHPGLGVVDVVAVRRPESRVVGVEVDSQRSSRQDDRGVLPRP